LEIDPAALFGLMENLPVGVMIVGATGEIEVMNAAVRKILKGVVDVDAYRWLEHDFELLNPDGSLISMHDLPMIRAINQGETIQDMLVQVRLKGQDREGPFLKVSSSPIFSSSGVITGAISVIQDVTDQHRLLEKMHTGITRERLVASLSKAFAETANDFPAVLQTISKTLAEALGDACVIHLANEDHTYLQFASWHHIQPDFMDMAAPVLEEIHLPVETSFEGQVFRDCQPALRSTTISEVLPGLLDLLTPAQAQNASFCEMIAPLMTPRHVLGTIGIWKHQGQPEFCEEDLKFFQDLAGRAAMAIENARLYAEEVQRNRELNSLRDATIALMSTIDLELLLGRILDAALHAIPAAERGLLFLAAPRTGRLELRAMLGFNDPRIRRANILKSGNIESAIAARKPFLINDFLHEERLNEFLEEETMFFRSAIFAPLVLGSEVLGVLTLSSSQAYAFAQADLRLLASFAATTTAALHNALLHAEVQKIAITDPLTGLHNRRGLEELGRHEVDRFLRFGHPLSVAMLDIDHFKRVNDSYGHGVGDQVLKGLAERCRSIIRQVDIFGRYGGEEFVILLPETDLFQAVNIAERLRRSVAETPFITDQGAISITISLGVTRASKNFHELDALIEQVDAALYDAKIKGRNRVEIG